MKFSLEWLLNIKQNELSSIELELTTINSSIAHNQDMQESNKQAILKFKSQLYNCYETWYIFPTVRSIENLESVNAKLQKELTFLLKDKEMILNRYNNKHTEIKLLEKAKSNFLTKEKERIDKKEQAEIQELSLITRKEN